MGNDVTCHNTGSSGLATVAHTDTVVPCECFGVARCCEEGSSKPSWAAAAYHVAIVAVGKVGGVELAEAKCC